MQRFRHGHCHHHTAPSAELENLAAAGGASLPSGGGSGSGGGAGGESYEDLCKAHIDAFMRAAAAAEVQTELASRCARSCRVGGGSSRGTGQGLLTALVSMCRICCGMLARGSRFADLLESWSSTEARC